MKKILYILGIVVLAAPSAALASDFKAGEVYSVGSAEVVNENLYIGGANVDMSGTVNGDLLIGGGNVSITGNVAEDLMVGGGTINVYGDVKDDLRIGGGNINISGNVGGELIGFGGQIGVLPDSTIGEDLTLNAGSIRIDGAVGGDVIANGGDVYINGPVAGSTTVRAESVRLGPNAVLQGNLDYYSKSPANIESGAQVLGEQNFHEVEAAAKQKTAKNFGRGFLFGFITVLMLIKTLMIALVAILFAYLWKRWTNSFVSDVMGSFWKRTLLGFAALFLTPIAFILLMISVVGIIPGILMILLYVFGIILSCILGGILTAALMEKYVFKKSKIDLNWWKIAIGVLLFNVVRIIPFVGWIAAMILFLATFGWLVNNLSKFLAKAMR